MPTSILLPLVAALILPTAPLSGDGTPEHPYVLGDPDHPEVLMEPDDDDDGLREPWPDENGDYLVSAPEGSQWLEVRSGDVFAPIALSERIRPRMKDELHPTLRKWANNITPGGIWNYGGNAGLWYLDLYVRSFSYDGVGLRLAELVQFLDDADVGRAIRLAKEAAANA